MDAPHLRHISSRVIVSCSLVFLVGMSLSCRSIEAPLVDVQHSAAVGSSESQGCFKACREAYRAAVKDEMERYLGEVRACGQDEECRREARERHLQNIEGLKQDRTDCMNGCYNEGGGGGR